MEKIVKAAKAYFHEKKTINSALKKILENMAYERAGLTPPYDEEGLFGEIKAAAEAKEEAFSQVTDEEAVVSVEFFEKWDGKSYKKGERVREGETLYKAKQDIAANPTWRPSLTPTLWEPLAGTGEKGSISNPITAVAGMTYVTGKYYAEDGKLYLCKREGTPDGTEFALQFLPSQLVGHYFEEVTE